MKNTSHFAKGAIALALTAGLLSPAFALAKNDKNEDKGPKVKTTETTHVTLNSTTTTGSGTTSTSEGSSSKGGFMWRIRQLLSGGAGKSGKVPPGLMHAPGIWKKLGNQGPTAPGALTITNIKVSQVTSSSAKISWFTNLSTATKLVYGTSSELASSTSSTLTGSSFMMPHSVSMTGLTASTTYFFKITATDKNGTSLSSAVQSFTTSGSGVVVDITAPTISGIAATSTAGALHIVWTTNEPANSKVVYGTVTPIGSASSTLSVSSTSLVTSHDVILPSLTASTTYYYTVSSADAAGNTSVSSEYNFLLQ